MYSLLHRNEARSELSTELENAMTSNLSPYRSALITGKLRVTLARMCREHGFELALVWLDEMDRALLSCAGGWYKMTKGNTAFARTCLALKLNMRSTLLGESFDRNETRWLSPVTTDQNVHRAAMIRLAGFQTACFVPVVCNGTPAAIVEFYDLRKREEDPALMQTLQSGLQASGDDITLLRMQQDLRDRERVLTIIEEVAHTGRWEWDPVRDVMQFSDGMYVLTGLDPDGFRGRLAELFSIIHHEDRTRVHDGLQSLLSRTVRDFTMEYRVVRPDGTVRQLHNAGTIIRDERDRAVRVVGICMDLTELHQAEAERERHERRYRLLFQNAAFGVIISDEHDRIIEANPCFRSMFGFGDDDLAGTQFAHLLRPSKPIWQSPLFEELRSGERSSLEVEKQYIVGDRPVDVRIRMIGFSETENRDSPWYCVRTVEDITRTKELQKQLTQTEQRRSSELRHFAYQIQNAQEEERRRIASDLHDDLCQRLSGMKLSIEVFEDDVRSADTGAFEKLQSLKLQLEDMIDEVRRMSTSLRPSVLDDFGLVPALKVMAQDWSHMHEITIQISSDGYRASDSLRDLDTTLYRITQEALSNVLQHSQATAVEIELNSIAEGVQLAVRDNGTGFDPDEVRYPEQGLRGMGLMSMRERAEQRNGMLRILSKPGAGTTIEVTLPCPRNKETE